MMTISCIFLVVQEKGQYCSAMNRSFLLSYGVLGLFWGMHLMVLMCVCVFFPLLSQHPPFSDQTFYLSSELLVLIDGNYIIGFFSFLSFFFPWFVRPSPRTATCRAKPELTLTCTYLPCT